jgi:hypothetical protein
MTQREPGTSLSSLTGKVEDSQDSTVAVTVNSETRNLAAQAAQVNAEISVAGVPAAVPSASQVFTPHFYQRLPHPLSHLVKELPVVDGIDVNLLCDFLAQVLKIRYVGQMAERTIYEIMYPCCRGELLTLVTQAITAKESFENFHARALGQFIPSRQMSQLRAASYERVQFEGESFATYA